MNIDDSNAVRFLRFPLICAVVFIHTDLRPYCPWTEDLTFFSGFVYAFLNIGCSVAVPAFMFIAGFLFFRGGRRFEWSMYLAKLKRRFHSILIPYLLWNAIYFLVVLLLQSLSRNFSLLLHKPIADFSLHDYFYIFWNLQAITRLPDDQTAPLVTQFWFLQCLMVLILIAPLIWTGIRYLHLFFPLAILLADLANLIPNAPGIVPSTYFYFTIGAFLAIHDYSPVSLAAKAHKMVYPLLLLTLTVQAYSTEPLVNSLAVCLTNLLLIAVLFRLAALAANRQMPLAGILTASTFFIFAIHRFFTAAFTYLARTELIPTRSEWSAGVCYVAGSIIVLTLCVALFAFMNRYFNTVTAYLTGNRS